MERSKTRQEIAHEYGVHRKTLARWLKKAGIQLPNGLVNPKYQDIIYQHFGVPNGVRAPFVPTM